MGSYEGVKKAFKDIQIGVLEVFTGVSHVVGGVLKVVGAIQYVWSENNSVAEIVETILSYLRSFAYNVKNS